MLKIISALLLSLFLLGCSGRSPNLSTDNVGSPSIPIAQSLDNIKENSTEVIKPETDNIIQKSNDIETIVTDKIKPIIPLETSSILDQLNNDVQEIKNSAEKIQQANKENISKIDIIEKSNHDVKRLETQNAKLKADLDSARQDGIKGLYTSLKFFFGIAFLAIMAGLVLAFFVDRRLGLSIAGVGLLGLALATGAVYYLQTIAFIAMGIIIASIAVCVIIGIIALIKINKDKKVLHTANIENVGLIEDIKKNHLDEDTTKKIFGVETPLAKEWQSPSTVQVVKIAKEELKKSGDI